MALAVLWIFHALVKAPLVHLFPDAIRLRIAGRIRPFHRIGGKAGKAAALKDAMELVDTEVILIFDADYIPGAGLIKQLVAPFFDLEVGGGVGSDDARGARTDRSRRAC